MESKDETILNILRSAGALIENTHVVYQSGLHGSKYVNKDAIYLDPIYLDRLCLALAEQFYTLDIDVVVAPAIGGIDLKTGVARHLSKHYKRKVLCAYAERADRILQVNEPTTPIYAGHLEIPPGSSLVLKLPQFVFGRGYGKHIKDKLVLALEDVINTGDTVLKLITAIRSAGGNVVGVGTICNRGEMVAETLGVPYLYSLLDIPGEVYQEQDCPLCKASVPINEEFGHGREYISRRNRSR